MEVAQYSEVFSGIKEPGEIVKINYFSAVIDPDHRISEKRDKQKRYFKALSSLSLVHPIILGTYQKREVTCGAQCRQKYLVLEEKKTDVNIAIRMMADAFKGNAENLILVSGDSDLQPVVHWIKVNCPSIVITVYIPSLPEDERKRAPSYYNTINVAWKFLPLGKIGQFQFPVTVTLPDGNTVTRPVEWS